jgi:hypothetical protein
MASWERWRSQLVAEDAVRPHRAVRAVLPNWEAWRGRGGVPLTFMMTQVLTGCGVFGEYLLRIQREVTSTIVRKRTRRNIPWSSAQLGRNRDTSRSSSSARDWPLKRSSRPCSKGPRRSTPPP